LWALLSVIPKKSMNKQFNAHHLVLPYFAADGKKGKQPIPFFPGTYRFSTNALLNDLEETQALGIDKILLFGVPGDKDERGQGAWSKESVVARTVRAIRKRFPRLTVMTDVCLCAYTSHGHCGILKYGPWSAVHSPWNNSPWAIDHARTLEALAKTAVAHADAGADWVAPSAMAKRQVAAIRRGLDANGFKKTRILGYSAKFASHFYGPFRQAARSAPRFGDRKGYQLDFRGSRQAMREIRDDIREGADAVMVKPALAYLDVILAARQKFHKPLFAYNVSGEYAMAEYGGQKGLWDRQGMMTEILASIRRAGANYIITYHAKEAARLLKRMP